MGNAPAVFTDLSLQQVESLVSALGEPAFRANQLLGWVYQRLAASFDEMTDVPVGMRQKLVGQLSVHSLVPIREAVSRDGTVKTLFRLGDGNTIEAALMLYAAGAGRPRTTVCISSQAGCAIGCPFCATGRQGLERSLTPGEMIDQVLHFARRVRDRGGVSEKRSEHITNIVFMGMGEPLANYDALMQAIGVLTSPRGFGTSPRNITISTAGMVPQMGRLAEEKVRVGLAVSLHAPDNQLRSKLVPLNRRYPIEELIPACREYAQKTGRRVSFEYTLFAGVNDSLAQARMLARVLSGMDAHVNLITANPACGDEYKPSSRRQVLAFEQELRLAGINCTLRVSRGQDIQAGCGQLRAQSLG